MADTGRDDARRRQEKKTDAHFREEQRKIDREAIDEAGIWGWMNAPSARGYSEISRRRESFRKEGNPDMADIKTIADAGVASDGVHTIVTRDFKNLIESAKAKIEAAKEELEAIGTVGHDSEGALTDSAALTKEVADYFENFAGVLAANEADNSRELQAEELALEAAVLITAINPQVESLRNRATQAIGVLDEAMRQIEIIFGMTDGAGDKLQELTELVNNISA